MNISSDGAGAPRATRPEPSVRVDRAERGVAKVTLNRPDRLNALDVGTVGSLHQVLDEMATDESCRVVILTGAGRAFCAGLDLNGYGDPAAPEAAAVGMDHSGNLQRSLRVQVHIASLIERLRSLPQPVIAAVNGAASGGGLALALGSDIRIAGASARFNAAFVRIGLSACDIGTSWLLPRLVGAGRAHELMLTGRFVEASEAEQIGLVTAVVADEQLMDRALHDAALIIRNSPLGVRMTKEVMWSALEISAQRAAIDLENRTQILLTGTQDHREAVSAFLDGREPAFSGR